MWAQRLTAPEGIPWPLAQEDTAAATFPHTCEPDSLPPRESAPLPAGPNLSRPAARPGQAAAPQSWDQQGTRAVTETCQTPSSLTGTTAEKM